MAGSVLIIPFLSVFGSLALWIMGAGPLAILAWFFAIGPLLGIGLVALLSRLDRGAGRRQSSRRSLDDPAER
ncbi:hypothetical protein [Mangrovicoccus sp. HB161399]|uniref:hypothetical protein n=1 Tax=Mangrovicoccus sp. HB161399 TaxID=2720392 RepID=UPI001555705A|nr:hypothetical protein [Mangrovicoccus sp. HB161399]